MFVAHRLISSSDKVVERKEGGRGSLTACAFPINQSIVEGERSRLQFSRLAWGVGVDIKLIFRQTFNRIVDLFDVLDK